MRKTPKQVRGDTTSLFISPNFCYYIKRKESTMPQQIICLKHKTRLEPDGICHKCVLERCEENAPQFTEFGKLLSKKRGVKTKPNSSK